AYKLRDLITDLLNYSRISVDDVFQKTNLNALIDETLADLEIPISEKTPTITVSQLPEVDAIPSLMRQMFQNLISNSLKFCRADVPCEITIHGERVATKSIHAEPAENGAYSR